MNQRLCDKVVMTEERHDNSCKYTYQLILREGERVADWKLPLYSIRISLVDDKGHKSEKEARDLFTNRERAVSFFEKLVRNLATPIDLGYVVEDEIRT